MLKKTVIMSVALVSIAAAALAHKGATGIVKERMDGMSAMGQAVKSLTPMMRGQSTFDADAVRASADVMIMHAGEQMSRLFPEGSGGMPSSAMPAVWDEWDEFTALAAQLEVTAKGMKLGADNGLAAAQASGSASVLPVTNNSALRKTDSMRKWIWGLAAELM